jgi:FKBP-type peptidyl-prolyl cis-trans isomerase
MNTRNIASGMLVVGLAVIIFVNVNPIKNNRYNPSNEPNGVGEVVANDSKINTLNFDERNILGDQRLSELETDIKIEGDGEAIVKTGDTISVNYVGWLATDGTVFDSSLNTGRIPFKFTVGTGVIEGWSKGVVGMKTGEVRELRIPSDLAYGENGMNTIPGDTDLIFYVELISID